MDFVVGQNCEHLHFSYISLWYEMCVACEHSLRWCYPDNLMRMQILLHCCGSSRSRNN